MNILEVLESYKGSNQVAMISGDKEITYFQLWSQSDKLAAYKASLSEEEIEKLVLDTKKLAAYQEEPSAPEDLEKIPVLKREDISHKIAPIYNTEVYVDDTLIVHHEIETNGIGYLEVMFDLSEVPEEKLPYVGILQNVLGLIDTENYEYAELFNEINMNTGGIGTTLEMYPNVEKAHEKEFKATLEVKTKALYGQMPKALASFSRLRRTVSRSRSVAMRTMGRRGWTTASSSTSVLPWVHSPYSMPLEVSIITPWPDSTWTPQGSK